MRTVGLKFLLKGPMFVAVLLPEPNAKIIIRDWKAGVLKPIIGDESDILMPWAVKTEEISAIHFFNPEEAVQSAPQRLGSGSFRVDI